MITAEGPVYCAGHDRWPAAVLGKRVTAEGDLRPARSDGTERVLGTCAAWVIVARPTFNETSISDWARANAKDEDGNNRRLRLPTIITFKDGDWPMIEQTSLGFTDDLGGIESVTLDDSALGIALSSRVRGLCKGSEPTCVLQIEGYWGRLLETASNAGIPGQAFSVVEPPRLIRQETSSASVAWRLW